MVRRIEGRVPVAYVEGEEHLHPYGPGQSSTGPAMAVPALDLEEEPPVPPPARAYVPDPVPAPPSRRGWLLRAIEGIFG